VSAPIGRVCRHVAESLIFEASGGGRDTNHREMTEELEPPLFDPETLRTSAIELIRRAEHLRDRADDMIRHADELLRQAEEYQAKPE